MCKKSAIVCPIMFDKILTFFFGSQNERDVKALRPVVAQIIAKESWAQAFKDEDFPRQTQAFKDRLGEVVISALPVEELTTKEDFFVETLQVVLAQKETKRVMIVPGEDLYRRVMLTLQKTDTTDHELTVFSMQPAMAGNAFRHEILGYSLMSALGIRSDEINPNQ